MSEAFAASVRALELPDEAAMLKAMGRGELEARVREYARAEAVAPPDVQRGDRPLRRGAGALPQQAEAAREAGDEERARSAEALTADPETDRERLQVADAARREWEEATAAAAEEAGRSRAELSHRGSVRWSGTRLEAAKGPRTRPSSSKPTPPRLKETETSAALTLPSMPRPRHGPKPRPIWGPMSTPVHSPSWPRLTPSWPPSTATHSTKT